MDDIQLCGSSLPNKPISCSLWIGDDQSPKKNPCLCCDWNPQRFQPGYSCRMWLSGELLYHPGREESLPFVTANIFFFFFTDLLKANSYEYGLFVLIIIIIIIMILFL